jgi:hypothetical protein
MMGIVIDEADIVGQLEELKPARRAPKCPQRLADDHQWKVEHNPQAHDGQGVEDVVPTGNLEPKDP